MTNSFANGLCFIIKETIYTHTSSILIQPLLVVVKEFDFITLITQNNKFICKELSVV